MNTSGLSALKGIFFNEENNEEYQKREPKKESLDNTFIRLRKLPQKYRETLYDFIKGEEAENVESIGNIIYFYLTRASHVSIPSMCFSTESLDKRDFIPFQSQAPYFMATLMPAKREEIWEDAHTAAAYLEMATTEEREIFFTKLTQPHTPDETKQIHDFEQRFNENAAARAQKAHEYAMANDSEYAKLIREHEQETSRKEYSPKIMPNFGFFTVAGVVTFAAALAVLKGCEHLRYSVMKKNVPVQCDAQHQNTQ